MYQKLTADYYSSEIGSALRAPSSAPKDCGFREAVESALSGGAPTGDSLRLETGGFTVISRGIELKMRDDPSFAEEISQKLGRLTSRLGGKGSELVIVDRSGEIAQYDLRAKKKDYPTREELRETEKERLRRKARLDAYFKIVQQLSIKRKLIEQDNIRRPTGKRYRCAGTVFDSIAQSILQKPNRTQEFYF